MMLRNSDKAVKRVGVTTMCLSNIGAQCVNTPSEQSQSSAYRNPIDLLSK